MRVLAHFPTFVAAGIVVVDADTPTNARLHAANALGVPPEETDLSTIHLVLLDPGAPMQTARDVVALGGVAARNSLTHIDSIPLLKMIDTAERDGKNRVIVTAAVQARINALRKAGAPEVDPTPEPVPDVPTDSKECPKCHAHGDIAGTFGYRVMKQTRKDGTVITVTRPQSYCNKCRGGKAAPA